MGETSRCRYPDSAINNSRDSRFLLHVRNKNAKGQGYDLSTTKYISSNAKGKRRRVTTQYTNITTSQAALNHYTVLELQEPSIVSTLKPTPSEYARLNFPNTPGSLACGCGRPMKTTTHHPPPAPKHNF